MQTTQSYHPVLVDLAEKLEEVVSSNDDRAAVNEPGSATTASSAADWGTPYIYNPVFEGQWAAGISINDFLVRLCKYGGSSPGTFVAMAVHVDRLCRKMRLTSLNVHRLLLGAFVCAAKASDDRRVCMTHYGNIAGISLEDVNSIEREYLKVIEWDLYVREEEVADGALKELTYGADTAAGVVSPADSALSCSTVASLSLDITSLCDAAEQLHLQGSTAASAKKFEFTQVLSADAIVANDIAGGTPQMHNMIQQQAVFAPQYTQAWCAQSGLYAGYCQGVMHPAAVF